MSVKTQEWIRAELMKLGYSQASWARENKFHPRAVQRCIKRYAPSNGVSPKRMEARTIMSALSKSIGVDLLGGDQ
ncbi:hypothetical protein Tola_0713 [Tolumonas auensis DSM 9187]|uniref:Uncharacterized protein n=1 Tax=Tolumonas auensis (strain DSM 9187 / NBRC 110442 / TA 4) TaxID=595494 RepID=C4LBA6_TOLAT|nr:hypothetical protein [Tolumonas auensis]ACQ92341.1 hypothetical protein Tola_0713 [Tolumonas auensis DSM 9187]